MSSKLVAIETLVEYHDTIFNGANSYVHSSARGTMNSSNEPGTLTKADIPGASLGNREPEKFKIAALRFWLQCQGAHQLSTLKTKANYVQL